MCRKSSSQCHARHFGKCARHLNPNRSCTDQREGQLPLNCLAGSLSKESHFLSSLEREQDLAANRFGVIERFETPRK